MSQCELTVETWLHDFVSLTCLLTTCLQLIENSIIDSTVDLTGDTESRVILGGRLVMWHDDDDLTIIQHLQKDLQVAAICQTDTHTLLDTSEACISQPADVQCNNAVQHTTQWHPSVNHVHAIYTLTLTYLVNSYWAKDQWPVCTIFTQHAVCTVVIHYRQQKLAINMNRRH